MLREPLNGLMKAMNAPSGEICAPAISGSPKNSSRSISGGGCAHTGAVSARIIRIESITTPVIDRRDCPIERIQDRKSTRLNSSHLVISYAVFCLKKKTPHDQ